MALWGQARDNSFLTKINRELMGRIIEQKCGYYKIILSQTPSNIYGESLVKTFKDPVLINVLIDREDQTFDTENDTVDTNQALSFRFFKQDLVDIQLVPEVGDILLWNEHYFEVDGVVENQFVVGKDPNYSYDATTDSFGTSVSIILNTHRTRAEKLGITNQR